MLRAEERQPDLIITDYMMPDIAGLALSQCLRQLRSTQRIPIIIHTAVHTAALPPKSQLYGLVVTKHGEVLALVGEVHKLLAQFD